MKNRTEETPYEFYQRAGQAVWSFGLHVLFLLASYEMALRIFPLYVLSGFQWCFLFGILAALVVQFDLLLPALTSRLSHHILRSIVRVGASSFMIAILFRLFYRVYLKNQVSLTYGFWTMIAAYIDGYNSYYQKNIQLPQGDSAALVSVVFFVIAAVLAAQYLLVCLTGKRVCVLIVPLAVLILLLAIGLAPQVEAIGFFSFACVYLAAGNVKKALLRAAVVALWCVLFALVWLCGSPAAKVMCGYEQKLQIYQKNTADEICAFVSANIWGTTETVDNSCPDFSDEKILSITTDKEISGNLYLKSFVGTVYDEGVWNADGSSYEDALATSGVDDSEMDERLWDMYMNAWENGQLLTKAGVATYSIRYYHNAVGNLLVPYFSSIDDSKKVTVAADQTRKVSWGTKTITAVGPAANDISNLLLELASTYDNEVEEDDAWEWYDTYVNSQCLAETDSLEEVEIIAEKLRTRFPSLCSMADNNMSRVIKARMVANYLMENYTYSWNLDAIADNTDPVGYFLTDGGRGYCMHFASAGTLILRDLGIAARYAEGYVVKSGSFVSNGDATYTADVYDRSAHAWTEIYLDGIGWVPIDMTPGYTEESDLLPTDQAAEEERKKEEQKEAAKMSEENSGQDSEDDETVGEADEKSQEAENKSAADVSVGAEASEDPAADFGCAPASASSIVCIAAALAIFALTLIGFQRWRIGAVRAHVNRLIGDGQCKTAVMCVHRQLARRVGRRRKRDTALTDRELERVFAQQFPKVSKETWDRYIKIAEMAAFSGREVLPEDASFCVNLYDRIMTYK